MLCVTSGGEPPSERLFSMRHLGRARPPSPPPNPGLKTHPRLSPRYPPRYPPRCSPLTPPLLANLPAPFAMDPRLSPLADRLARRSALALILAIGIGSAGVRGQDASTVPAIGASALSLIEHARQGNPGFAAARAEAAAAHE